jgi:hypothetical protein
VVTRVQHARFRQAKRVRQSWIVRLLTLGLVTLLAAIAMAAVEAPGAWAADAPDSLSIAGSGLHKPISVHATNQQDLFAALLRQVSWMAGQPGDPIQPDPAKLGPKFTLTVFVNNAAAQVYELYPQAPGGPRAHRPAAAPNNGAEAWFYASVAMPETLEVAGVPLAQAGPSGVGGMFYEDPAGFVPAAVTTEGPSLSLGKTLREQSRTVLLWLATPFLVLLLLFAAARRSRRYGHG